MNSCLPAPPPTTARMKGLVVVNLCAPCFKRSRICAYLSANPEIGLTAVRTEGVLVKQALPLIGIEVGVIPISKLRTLYLTGGRRSEQ